MGLGARVYGKRRRARLSAGGPGTGRGRTLMAPRTDIRALPAIADAQAVARRRWAGANPLRLPPRHEPVRALERRWTTSCCARARGLGTAGVGEHRAADRDLLRRPLGCSRACAARPPARPAHLGARIGREMRRGCIDLGSTRGAGAGRARQRLAAVKAAKRLARHATLGDSPVFDPTPRRRCPDSRRCRAARRGSQYRGRPRAVTARSRRGVNRCAAAAGLRATRGATTTPRCSRTRA